MGLPLWIWIGVRCTVTQHGVDVLLLHIVRVVEWRNDAGAAVLVQGLKVFLQMLDVSIGTLQPPPHPDTQLIQIRLPFVWSSTSCLPHALDVAEQSPEVPQRRRRLRRLPAQRLGTPTLGLKQ